MNSKKDVLARLLKLFPVNVLREYYPDISGYQEDLIRIIPDQFDEKSIIDFSFSNFEYTKQHIYLYEHNIKDLSKLPTSFLKDEKVMIKQNTEQSKTHFYWLDLQFEIIQTSPIEQTHIDFYWPIKIYINKDFAMISFTIIERNIRLLLKQLFKGRNSIVTGKNTDEQMITNLFLATCGNSGNFTPYNLEKGIKELWKEDIVDAMYVSYKKDKSTSAEYMDEKLTLKDQYKKLYDDIMNRPLNKIVLKFLSEKDVYGDHITVDPAAGFISLSTFSKFKDRPTNAIKKILEKN